LSVLFEPTKYPRYSDTENDTTSESANANASESKSHRDGESDNASARKTNSGSTNTSEDGNTSDKERKSGNTSDKTSDSDRKNKVDDAVPAGRTYEFYRQDPDQANPGGGDGPYHAVRLQPHQHLQSRRRDAVHRPSDEKE